MVAVNHADDGGHPGGHAAADVDADKEHVSVESGEAGGGASGGPPEGGAGAGEPECDCGLPAAGHGGVEKVQLQSVEEHGDCVCASAAVYRLLFGASGAGCGQGAEHGGRGDAVVQRPDRGGSDVCVAGHLRGDVSADG